MAKLEHMPEPMRSHIAKLPCPTFSTKPWTIGPNLKERRIAIISTAGLHRRGDRPFEGMAGDYRIIPGDIAAGDLVMTHLSTNFDRTGFQQDWNLVFPIDRLKELADEGMIGSPKSGRAFAWRSGHCCASGAGLTILHARRGRAGTLSGSKRHCHHSDQSHSGTYRKNLSSSGALGTV